MPPKPTPDQLHAVQKVLYEPGRLRQLSALQRKLARLMNLDPTVQLQSRDVRNPPGSGPQWFYPDTGAIDQNVVLAAGLCDQIAAVLLAIRADVAKVDFPGPDKTHLLTAIHEEAASWSARGQVWKAPGSPGGDATQALARVSGHVSASLAAARQVRSYLRTKDQVGIA